MNWHLTFARLMAILGMSLKDIEEMTLVQFLLYSVEASEIEKQRIEGGSGIQGGGYTASGVQNFRNQT